jgi:hypothetical protein
MELEKRNAENAIQRRLESQVSLILQRVTSISNWYALSIRNVVYRAAFAAVCGNASPPSPKGRLRRVIKPGCICVVPLIRIPSFLVALQKTKSAQGEIPPGRCVCCFTQINYLTTVSQWMKECKSRDVDVRRGFEAVQRRFARQEGWDTKTRGSPHS